MVLRKIFLLTIVVCCIHYTLSQDQQQLNDMLAKFEQMMKDNKNISPEQLQGLMK